MYPSEEVDNMLTASSFERQVEHVLHAWVGFRCFPSFEGIRNYCRWLQRIGWHNEECVSYALSQFLDALYFAHIFSPHILFKVVLLLDFNKFIYLKEYENNSITTINYSLHNGNVICNLVIINHTKIQKHV